MIYKIGCLKIRLRNEYRYQRHLYKCKAVCVAIALLRIRGR